MTRQNKKASVKVVLLILLVIISIGVFGVLYLKNWYDDAIFSSPKRSESYQVIIDEGDTLSMVMDELEENGVIESKLAVQVYLKLESLNPTINFGTHTIPTESNIPDILSILSNVSYKIGVSVTVQEGLRYEKIANILEEGLSETTQFDKTEFINIAKSPDSYTFSEDIAGFLNEHKPAGKPLRGFLYPDTYSVDEGMTTLEIVEIMLTNFKIKVEENIDFNDLTRNQDKIDSIYDALKLASIIEKESSANDNRSKISSVFHNRLAVDHPLQSDASINFITGKYDPGVKIADTKIDDPYNTYIYAGLMPTPIDNPRIDSIIAAFKPKDTDFFFFFHDNVGQSYFSVTLGEHNQKVGEIRGWN